MTTTFNLLQDYPNFNHNLNSHDLAMLNEYYNSVVLLSNNGLNLEFNNKDKNHAVIVMSSIFKKAENNINIFAGNFNGSISNNDMYRDTLKEAIISRSVSINIIFESTPNTNSLCLNDLKYLRNKGHNVSINSLTPQYISNIKSINPNHEFKHFTYSDGKMFRFELDKQAFKAFCNFDDSNVVATLNKNFNTLLQNSIQVN